jgi:hypothetical protein
MLETIYLLNSNFLKMKTLKLKMQDLTNPTILTSHEIKNIMGGSGGTGSDGSIGGICYITSYMNGIEATNENYYIGTCPQQSALANQACVNAIVGMGFDRCTYDCACDGLGH